MEARWLALPEEDRVATRKMSPSPEEVNLLEKEWKRAAEKGKGKEQHGVANVAGEPEAETPPNEKVDKAEGGGGYVKKRKLETRQTWEDVEKLEEEEMGVPVAKVSPESRSDRTSELPRLREAAREVVSARFP